MGQTEEIINLMKVLFVGATGVIGSQTTPFLADEFDLTLAAFGGGQVEGRAVQHCDVCDQSAMQALMESEPFDAVVNCAVAPHQEVNLKDEAERLAYYERCMEINARGAYRLFEAAWQARIERVVYISSLTAVLGKPHYEFIARDAPDRPRDIYAASKVFGEHAGRYFAFRSDSDEARRMKVTCLRLGQPFPALNSSDDRWRHDAPDAKRGRGHGLMAHVEDIAQAIALALRCDDAYRVAPVVSNPDVPYVDDSALRELGYAPRWNFTAQGLTKQISP